MNFYGGLPGWYWGFRQHGYSPKASAGLLRDVLAKAKCLGLNDLDNYEVWIDKTMTHFRQDDGGAAI